jgi:hypothetical protein
LIALSGPNASIVTPRGSFRTRPRIARRWASRYTHGRNPTPCTVPRTSIRRPAITVRLQRHRERTRQPPTSLRRSTLATRASTCLAYPHSAPCICAAVPCSRATPGSENSLAVLTNLGVERRVRPPGPHDRARTSLERERAHDREPRRRRSDRPGPRPCCSRSPFDRSGRYTPRVRAT